ncbi:probable oxidoreductase, Zn-binding [Alloactinosynnema sp. L-07]|uniref:NAD(P)-dependent alcohol dehydrogenase n=1 Tax=Alloactinosynnema sp. L-07 TaxID=1653480 RepID=UPI00065EFD43|nr:NAD(P)-dependent alcohol dehydrogenase [Alloactinosynnema sp. L-07]CRK56482.1 probable oxidoreductase, Zn-binding [Alloactinosynnema sp. L-07]
MKAIVQDRYGSTDALEFRDIDTPTPADGEVLLRVHAAGVDPGVWHLMTGLPYLVRFFGYGVRKPKVRVCGQDVAGRVEAVGKGVTRFKPGDEVFGTCTGSFAEYACGRQDRLARIPANLRADQAAAVPASGLSALQGLRDLGKLQSGQKVLIIGAAGGVGTFAVQLAKALGAEVTGVCSATKVDLVRSLGADKVIDYTKDDYESGRYDLVLSTGGNRSLSELRRALTPTGTLVIVGGEGGGRWLGMMSLIFKATALSPFVKHNIRSLMSVPHAEDLEALREYIEDGTVMPIMDRTYSLNEAAEAINRVHNGQSRGKVVITTT